MRESYRLHLLQVRSRSEMTMPSRLGRTFKGLWKPDRDENSYWFVRLFRAGLGKLSYTWFFISLFFSVAIGLIFTLLFSLVSGFSAAVLTGYLLMVRFVRWKSINRRVRFASQLVDFVKELDALTSKGKSVETAFEYSLETAKGGFLRKELRDLTNNQSLKQSILGLNKTIAGREAQIFSTSIFLLSGVESLQKEGIARLLRYLSPICESLVDRNVARKTLYVISGAVGFIILCIDLLAASFIPSVKHIPLVEMFVILQFFALTVCFDLADRAIGRV